MAQRFPTLGDGDQLAPWMLNVIYRELERLRKMVAMHPLSIESMDSTTLPPILVSHAVDQLIPVQLDGSGIAAGSIAAPSTGNVTLLGSASEGADFETAECATDTMYNIYSTAIGANKVCWACWYNGNLYLVAGDC